MTSKNKFNMFLEASRFVTFNALRETRADEEDLVPQENMDHLVRLDLRDLEVSKVIRVLLDPKAIKAIKALKDPRVILVNPYQAPLLCRLQCPL